MNIIKNSALVLSITILSISCQNNSQKEALAVSNTENLQVDVLAVTQVLKRYKDAIQALTTEGTTELFAEDAQVYESGGSEGTYSNYLDHHLGPELDYFESFTFSDYKIEAKVDLPYAFATETYVYTIKIKPDEEKGRQAKTIKKKGVATSVLKKINNQWKIISTHSSSRNTKKASH